MSIVINPVISDIIFYLLPMTNNYEKLLELKVTIYKSRNLYFYHSPFKASNIMLPSEMFKKHTSYYNGNGRKEFNTWLIIGIIFTCFRK